MKSFTNLMIAALLLSNVSYAQEEAELFGQLDKNKDGIIAANEVGVDKKRFFDRLIRVGDKNDDGKLSQAEFQATTTDTPPPTETPRVTDSPNRNRRGTNGASPEELFEKFDKNKDGKLTRLESPEGLGRLFDALRKDSVTIDDLKKARQRRDSTKGKTPNTKKSGTNDRANPEVANSMFKRLDKNADGKLTLKEVPERMQPTIKRALESLKKGADDSLTLTEFAEAASRFNRSRTQTARPTKAASDRPKSDKPADQSKTSQGPSFLRLLDKNRDGALDRDELAQAASLLKTLDKNDDGKLDMRELIGSRSSDRSGSGNRPNSRPSTTDLRSDQATGKTDRPALTDRSLNTPPDLVQRGFKKLDRNGDGGISRSEAPEKLRPQFDKADGNGDGKIQIGEIKKFLEGRKK